MLRNNYFLVTSELLFSYFVVVVGLPRKVTFELLLSNFAGRGKASYLVTFELLLSYFANWDKTWYLVTFELLLIIWPKSLVGVNALPNQSPSFLRSLSTRSGPVLGVGGDVQKGKLDMASKPLQCKD